MFRALVPRIVYQVQCSSRAHGPCFSRGFRSRGLPIYRHGFFDDCHTPRHISWPAQFVDKQFKQMQQVIDEMTSPSPRWFGPWARWAYTPGTVGEDKHVQVKYDKKLFEIKVNVSDFSPDELDVKVVEDRIVFNAKQSEKKDEYGFMSRDITRQFMIPEDVESDTLECVLSEGILTISAKVKGHENIKERTINIQKEEPAKTESDTKDN